MQPTSVTVCEQLEADFMFVSVTVREGVIILCFTAVKDGYQPVDVDLPSVTWWRDRSSDRRCCNHTHPSRLTAYFVPGTLWQSPFPAVTKTRRLL